MIDIKKYLEEQFKNVSNQYTSDINWQRSIDHIEKASKLIPKNAKVLDLGCGHGHHMYLLKQIRPDISIIGIDINTQKLWKLLKLERFDIRVMNGENLSFMDKTFDVILSFGVIEHVNNDIQFLKEANRVLKNDGKILIFNLPNKYSFTEIIAGLIGIENHKKRYSLKDLNLKLKYSDLKIYDHRLEFLIPAQFNQLSIRLNKFLNKYTKTIIRLDNMLCGTFLKHIAQSYYVHIRK